MDNNFGKSEGLKKDKMYEDVHEQQQTSSTHKLSSVGGGYERKSGFLTFVFATIPGAGQMYQGLMKKGVSIMIVFFGIIVLASAFYLDVVLFATPILWFYSFFDVLHRVHYTRDELNAVKDESLFNLKIPPLENTGGLQKILKHRHTLLGWIITFMGIYSLIVINVVNNTSLAQLIGNNAYNIVRDIARGIPGFAVPILCIIIGVKLIRGSDKKIKKDWSVKK